MRGGAVGSVRAEQARLFVALELPHEVRDALGQWTLAAIGHMAGMRPVTPDHLHVTLCFLGWQPVGQLDAVAEACHRLSMRSPATVGLREAVWLPPRRPRVLAIGLEDGGGRVGAIQAELSGLLETGGWYEPENRPYLPHITVARAGRRASVRQQSLPAPPSMSVTAWRVTLFRSRLSAAGARYEAMSSVELVSTA